jgi:hypothetical protein
MSNNLPTEKKAAIVSMLCEGSSVRGIERMTGVHRDTVMRLGVRVGQACTAIMDEKMRGCHRPALRLLQLLQGPRHNPLHSRNGSWRRIFSVERGGTGREDGRSMSEYLQNLKEAVTALHGCDCSHSDTTRVIEQFEGETVFGGDIETFALSGHPKASEAFAWAFHNGTEPQYIAVLKLPPITDPGDAVRAAIASGSFR